MFMIFLKWSNLYAHSAYFVFQEAKVANYRSNFSISCLVTIRSIYLGIHFLAEKGKYFEQ